jgi:hypothetical protein
MNLSKREKEKIFWALIEKLPEYEKGRNQAKTFFNGEKLDESLNNISDQEKEHYDLIKKFSKEVNIEIPEKI